MLTILTLAGALALSPLTSLAGQDETPRRDGPPLVSVADLRLEHYTPQHVSPYELLELAQHMVGRSVFVEERGGYASPPVNNMSVLGDNLVIYDTAATVERMQAALKALDQPGSGAQKGASAPLATIEYTPSFVSMDVALSALGSFQRLVSDRESSYPNISFARDRGLLVVRESKERLAEILQLLERIDTPKPQVRITCYLVSGVEEQAQDPGLPADLTSNLTKLVPGTVFEKVGFGMLQSAVVPNTQVSLKLDTNGDSFELSFVPVALDRESGALSVSNCELTKSKRSQGGVSAGDARIRIFSTDTLFRGDEYTVLGASGVDPIFVVVRVAPLGL